MESTGFYAGLDNNTRRTAPPEPPQAEWRYFTGAPKDAASSARQQLNYIPTRLKSTETH